MAKGNLSAQTVNPSTIKNPKKKTATQFWEYRDQATWRMKPYSMQTLEELADHLRAWAKLDDSFRINDFYNEHGISKQTFYELMSRCEKLQAAHEYAMNKLASRREIGSLLKKLDSATVFRSLAHYCDIDKGQYEWRIALAARAKADQESQTKHMVVLREMPSNPKVPERKK